MVATAIAEAGDAVINDREPVKTGSCPRKILSPWGLPPNTALRWNRPARSSPGGEEDRVRSAAAAEANDARRAHQESELAAECTMASE
jgi:hypothetical protein